MTGLYVFLIVIAAFIACMMVGLAFEELAAWKVRRRRNRRGGFLL